MIKNKKLISGLLCLAFIFSIFTMQVYANSINKTKKEIETCENCVNPEIAKFAKEQLGIEAEELLGKEAQQYIDIIGGINNAKAVIDNYTVIKVDPMDVIYIAATNKNDPNSAVLAMVDDKDKTVISLDFVTFSDDGSLSYKSFDNNLKMTENKVSQKELLEYNAKNEQELLSIIDSYKQEPINTLKITIPTNWQWYACKFAGFTACTLGCAVFLELPPVMFACKQACSYFWGKNLCNGM